MIHSANPSIGSVGSPKKMHLGQGILSRFIFLMMFSTGCSCTIRSFRVFEGPDDHHSPYMIDRGEPLVSPICEHKSSVP